ncbi:uncharacterized protein LOC141903203 [Tubulanus polymorphus]|uniref:uncharacterized protein LOC141903203 n=1 Tax=Tubulanus polymorphus TaxID=672921 RepID=UPI003DA631D7
MADADINAIPKVFPKSGIFETAAGHSDGSPRISYRGTEKKSRGLRRRNKRGEIQEIQIIPSDDESDTIESEKSYQGDQESTPVFISSQKLSPALSNKTYENGVKPRAKTESGEDSPRKNEKKTRKQRPKSDSHTKHLKHNSSDQEDTDENKKHPKRRWSLLRRKESYVGSDDENEDKTSSKRSSKSRKNDKDKDEKPSSKHKPEDKKSRWSIKKKKKNKEDEDGDDEESDNECSSKKNGISRHNSGKSDDDSKIRKSKEKESKDASKTNAKKKVPFWKRRKKKEQVQAGENGNGSESEPEEFSHLTNPNEEFRNYLMQKKNKTAAVKDRPLFSQRYVRPSVEMMQGLGVVNASLDEAEDTDTGEVKDLSNDESTANFTADMGKPRLLFCVKDYEDDNGDDDATDDDDSEPISHKSDDETRLDAKTKKCAVKDKRDAHLESVKGYSLFGRLKYRSKKNEKQATDSEAGSESEFEDKADDSKKAERKAKKKEAKKEMKDKKKKDKSKSGKSGRSSSIFEDEIQVIHLNRYTNDYSNDDDGDEVNRGKAKKKHHQKKGKKKKSESVSEDESVNEMKKERRKETNEKKERKPHGNEDKKKKSKKGYENIGKENQKSKVRSSREEKDGSSDDSGSDEERKRKVSKRSKWSKKKDADKSDEDKKRKDKKDGKQKSKKKENRRNSDSESDCGSDKDGASDKRKQKKTKKKGNDLDESDDERESSSKHKRKLGLFGRSKKKTERDWEDLESGDSEHSNRNGIGDVKVIRHHNAKTNHSGDDGSESDVDVKDRKASCISNRTSIGDIKDRIHPWNNPDDDVSDGLSDEPIYISCSNLYNLLNDVEATKDEKLIIIDSRDEDAFVKKHVQTAISSEDFSEGIEFSVFNDSLIIVYDANGRTYDLTDSRLSLVVDALRARALKPSILDQGFDRFSAKFSFMCRSSQDDGGSIITYPSEILDGKLYLGSDEHASSEDVLKHLSITHTVNISTEIGNAFPGRVEYLKVDESELPFNHFNSTVLFVSDALSAKRGGCCLVHCHQDGNAHSGAVVVAAIMYMQELSLKDAIDLVKSKRNCLHLGNTYCKSLLKFEKQVWGKKTDNNRLEGC